MLTFKSGDLWIEFCRDKSFLLLIFLEISEWRGVKCLRYFLKKQGTDAFGILPSSGLAPINTWWDYSEICTAFGTVRLGLSYVVRACLTSIKLQKKCLDFFVDGKGYILKIKNSARFLNCPNCCSGFVKFHRMYCILKWSEALSVQAHFLCQLGALKGTVAREF
jgi:hypothetical protein